MKKGLLSCLPAVAFIVLLCAGTALAGPAGICIVHVNDTHSHMEATSAKLLLGDDKTYVDLGGLGLFENFVAEKRRERPDMILLHAGDAVQGTLFFNTFGGKAEVEAMNRMSFDAMVPGNHEFDKGPSVLADMIGWAKFPTLSANIDASAEPSLAGTMQPYLVLEREGERIGVIGITSSDTPEIASPGDTLVFLDEADSVRKAIASLEAESVTRIIVLSHQGYEKDKAMASAVEGIDIIVGGHSHTLLGDTGELEKFGMTPKGEYPTVVQSPSGEPVYIVQSYEWAKTAGVLNVVFDEEGRVASCTGGPVFLTGGEFLRKRGNGDKTVVTMNERVKIMAAIHDNPALAYVHVDKGYEEFLAPMKKQLEVFETEIVAQAPKELSHIRVPGVLPSGKELPQGSQVAPLIADSMLYKVRKAGMDVDLALLNAGGVRVDIPQGDISVGLVYSMMPFGNTLVTMNLTGAEIRQVLSFGADTGEGAFLYPAGMGYTADMTRPDGERITAMSLKGADGTLTAMEDAASYSVVTISYLAGGGDKFTVFRDAGGHYDTGFIDAEAFMEYAQAKGELTPLQDTGVTYVPAP